MSELNVSHALEKQVWVGHNIDDSPDPSEVYSVDGRLRRPVKPTGGMWTSTYTPEAEFDCDWISWCVDVDYKGLGSHKWLLEPKDDLNLLVVNNIQDLEEIAERFEKDTYLGRPSSELPEVVLNFGKMAEEYDGVHLTRQGVSETNPLTTEKDEPDLRGWDCECTLHFRWNWTNVEYIGEVR